MKSFGEALREARTAKGITAVALARELGISVPYLNDVERNRRSPLSTWRCVSAAQFLDAPQLLEYERKELLERLAAIEHAIASLRKQSCLREPGAGHPET